ncbi:MULTISPECIES: four-carbon acid sugar kinase family protein [Prochlorococcus]|nr:hypothetical protein EV04_1669 [Prochlorococcus marinus str. LG]KGG23954.1 hypothetical protein EV09_0558 [Prochlorococcus marinus str. SS35]KGG31785.1 hypothetical protein EV10_1883 [Prochlorococcus marinus str. SS51]
MIKIVVFDDDPTGSQTVYGCPLLLRWDKEMVRKGLQDSSPLLFLLTNTRSLSPEMAEERLREICKVLKQVIKENALRYKDIFFISRGDSTLRGHGYLEPKVIHEELGPFDATFHVPAFIEGGRTTLNGIHLLNGIPVHKTIFAKDKIFGYKTSNLAFWLEDKSKGKINSKDVKSISLEKLKRANNNKIEMKNFINSLSKFSGNDSVIVDAETSADLSSFAYAIKDLHYKKNFLFRSAASLINALSGITSDSNSIKDFSSLRLKDESGTPRPGLVVIGSHVKLADDQLEVLLAEKCFDGVQLPVKKISRILSGSLRDTLLPDLENIWFKQLTNIMKRGKTPVLYTSRGELLLESNLERINFGIALSELISRLVSKISNKLGYVISKGGITTHTLLEKGLNLKSVNLKGQVVPGVSVVCPDEPYKVRLPIITFPGNLGDQKSLLNVWKIMENQ